MKTDLIEKLLAEATPGPWIFDDENVGKSGEWCWQLRTEYGGTPVYVEVSNRFNREVGHESTARLIAMAPDLAAEVVRLRKALQNAIDHHVAALAVVRGNLDDSYYAMAGEMEGACDRWRAALEGRE